MSKKLILILVILLIIIGVLYYFSNSKPINSKSLITQLPHKQVETAPTYPAYNIPSTKLSFSNNYASIDSEGRISSEIILDTLENKITALMLEIKYDPKILKFVSIEPIEILFQRKITRNLDEQTGRITFAWEASADFNLPITVSSEAIAELVFQPIIPMNSYLDKTEVTFLPSAYVTAEGINGSALTDTQDLTVVLAPQN